MYIKVKEFAVSKVLSISTMIDIVKMLVYSTGHVNWSVISIVKMLVHSTEHVKISGATMLFNIICYSLLLVIN